MRFCGPDGHWVRIPAGDLNPKCTERAESEAELTRDIPDLVDISNEA